MWIQREIDQYILASSGELIQIIIGPRQCGKSSLLWHLDSSFHEVTFDDLQMRTMANQDPALFLTQQKIPLIIDEAQYVPNIFPELKKVVDDWKRKRLKDKTALPSTLFRLTGSNQILLDKNVKESLVGRAGHYYLNTLSVSEILRSFSNMSIFEIMFKGGWPELYISKSNPVKYLNEYIRTFIEKDIVMSAGISKLQEFHTVIGMLAARTGEFINYSSIAQDSGVKSVTVKEWVSVLERANLIYLLKPYQSNLNKRLIKAPKIYFLDTGLACRLQGWQDQSPMTLSPQAGHLFETLVLAEIIKFNNNHGKNWDISLWRTKEGEEVDFIIKNENGDAIVIDAKMGIHSVEAIKVPESMKKTIPKIKQLIVVSLGGKRQFLSKDCLQVPIAELARYFHDSFT